MKALTLLAAMAFAGLVSSAAGAEEKFPSGAITMVVPFSAGGPTDFGVRLVGKRLAEIAGVPTVVENRGGGAGQVAARVVASAPPDGRTLLVAFVGTHALNQNLFKKLTYDPIKDFVPIISLWEYPSMLIVRNDSPFKTVADLVAAARAQPGKLSFASQGMGTAGHLLGEMIKGTHNVDMVHVPYKGASNAIIDLMAGRVDFSFSGGGSTLQLIKEKKLRALGVTDTRRSKLLPDIPTMAEAGFPEVLLTVWFGIAAPANTPPAVADKLYALFAETLRDKEVAARLEEYGFNVTAGARDEFAKRIASETERLGKIIRAAGINAN